MGRGWRSLCGVGAALALAVPAASGSTDRGAHDSLSWAGRCASGSSKGARVFVGKTTDLASLVARRPPGTTFCIEAGLHRLLRPIVPKSNDAFVGARGAVLSGARRITSISSRGGRWVATRQYQRNAAAHGECAAGSACQFPDDVFVDDRPLRRVLALGAVRRTSFYFDYARHEIWLGSAWRHHDVEAAVTTRAFRGWGSGADDVVIASLRIEMFANEAQIGAVNGRPTWTVERCDVRLNHGIGIQDAGTIVGNHVHDNGELGVGGSLLPRALVADNEIDHNGYARFDPGWESGGGKWLKTTNLVVRDNDVHDNWGPGLWTDTDNVRTTYLRNRIVSNTGPGIDHEASYDAVIAHNVVIGNGRGESGWLDGAGILVSSSPRVTISDNVVKDDADGIGLVQTDRGDGSDGPHVLQDVVVAHNTIVMPTGRTGLVNDTGDAALYTSDGNRFDTNTYVLGCAAQPFAWAREQGSGDYAYISKDAWVAAGNDTHSRFDVRCGNATG